jgi:hypothetical protein
MKAWLKHGFGLLAGLVFSCAALADEPAPIEDKDAFERQYVGCFESGLKDDCFVSLFVEGTVSRNAIDRDDVRDTIEKVSMDFLSKLDSPVYRVLVVGKDLVADIFDNRFYIVETESGKIIGVQVVFKKTKGKWRMFQFTVSGLKDTCNYLDMNCGDNN